MTQTAIVHRLNIIVLILLLILLAVSRPLLSPIALFLAASVLCLVLVLQILWTLASDSVRRSNA